MRGEQRSVGLASPCLYGENKMTVTLLEPTSAVIRPDNISLIQAFQDYKRHRVLKPKTLSNYEYVLRSSLSDWLYLPTSKITGKMVYERHTELSKRSKYLADLTFRVLRAIFKWSAAFYEDENGEAVITKNPVDKITGLRVWNGSNRRQDRIKPKDMPAWYAAVQAFDNVLIRDWLLTILFTGCRRMEITRLCWEQVDLEEGTITILESNSKNGKAHLIPMSDFLWDLMERRYKASTKTGWVFPSSFKQDAHLAEYDRTFFAIIKQTGIEFTIHDLRRTFTSIGTDLGLPEYQVKKLLNHSGKDNVTYGYYIADLEALRACIQAVTDEILNQATNSKYD